MVEIERVCEFQHAEGGDDNVRCEICPHRCLIAPDQTGICLCRKNFGGTLRPINYGQVTSAALDPIEKKPLYHFHPGQQILSLGTWGCNFKCDFCQNWQISQQVAPSEYLSPADAVAMAKQRGSFGIAYTYNEPTIWFEYVLDTGRLAHEAGLKNVLVTNGYVNAEPLEALFEVVDAMNIDLKSFSDLFYKKHAKARLNPVLESARLAAGRCHVETTTLLIPGENDSAEELEQLGSWISENLGRRTPTHLSAYFPRYKLDLPATDGATLQGARTILQKHLDFVYLGNIMGGEDGNTRCPQCGAVAVRRSGYRVDTSGLKGSACADCGSDLGFVLS